MKQNSRKEWVKTATQKLTMLLLLMIGILCHAHAQLKVQPKTLPPPQKPHQVDDHQCSRMHAHKQHIRENLKKKAMKIRASQHIQKMSRAGSRKRPFHLSSIAPAGAANNHETTETGCQYTPTQLAGLSTSALVAFLKANSDYDCVGTPLFEIGNHLPNLFSNQKIQAVFQEIYNLGASYDGTFASGIYGLLIYMHAATYQEFYNPNYVTLDAASKALYSQALGALSSNNHLFDLTDEALSVLKEYFTNCDYEGVRHQPFVLSVVKQAMRNLTINDNWKQISDNKLLRTYVGSYNGFFFLMFRGSGAPNEGDSQFWTAVDNDPELTSLLASVGKDAELLANPNLGFMVNNAVQELSRMAHIPGVISQIEGELASIINLYPRMEIKWFKATLALNQYGNCATYGLCEGEEALKEELHRYLFPNEYSLDDGKLLVKTPLGHKEVQKLYHAAKEVQAQFFKMLQTDQPVEGDVNETLNMVVFGSKSQYEDYASYLYGIDTNNGGIYIERRATFYTWDRTVGVESSLSLESLFRHEYCHYLQGRYLVPGYWGENEIYDNNRLVWYEEGMAEFFSGSTASDGIKLLASNANVVRGLGSNWPSLTDLFNTSYTSGNFHHYHYGNMAWYYWYTNDFSKLKTFFELTRSNDVAGFDNLVNSLKSSDESQYQTFLGQVNTKVVNGKEPSTKWLNDLQLILGKPSEVKAEFSQITGIQDVTASLETSMINKRFKITGSITGKGIANNNATAAQSTGDALNELLKNLRNNSKFNNFDYTVGYITNVSFAGGIPKANFVVTGPLRNPNISKDAAANFKASMRAVLVGTELQFIDQSVGQINNWTWSLIGGAPGISNVPNPAVAYKNAGRYDVALTANSQNGTTNTTSRNEYIRVYAKNNANYCTPATQNDFTSIRRVQLANIDHATEGFPANGYADHTSVLTELTQGQSFQLTVTPWHTRSDNIGVGVWIDWNQDGDFDDAGEQVMMQKGRFKEVKAMIQVPTNAVRDIATRMRVRLNYRVGENPQACGNDNFIGETEDYSVVVINEAIVEQAPVASFTSEVNYTIRGEALKFENTSLGNPTDILWEFPNGNPATSTANNPTVTYSTAGVYPVILTASNVTGRNQVIGYVTVRQGGGVDGNYCTASHNRDDVHINNVQLNTINNNSGSGTNGYEDYTAQSTTLLHNNQYALSIGATKDWDLNRVRVWIDWNQDGDFNDANERVLDVSGTGAPYNTLVAVPANAKEGGTRMRVRIAYADHAAPCGADGIGETEDYTVYVAPTLKAQFTANKTTIDAGESISFSDASTGNPTAWNWTFAGGSSTSSTLQNPVITYNTPGVYEVSLTVSNATGDHTQTIAAMITVTGDTTCTYCAATSNGSDYEHIAKVKLGDFDNASGAANYTDFTDKTITLYAGTTQTIALTPGYSGTAYDEYFKVWIDFNGDCDFDDAGELVYVSGATKTTVTGNIEVPSGIVKKTRMRIALKYNGAASAACGSFAHGEVEDYTVHIISDGVNPLPDYCKASAQQTNTEHITRVQIGNIDNESASSGYANYTDQTTNIMPGSSQDITVTPSASWTDSKLSIWVDWNQDGDFDDANEGTVVEGVGPYTVRLTAPNNAAIGTTRIRIRLSYGSSLSTACGDGWTGEVEDYSLNVSTQMARTTQASYRQRQAKVYPNPTTDGRFTVELPEAHRLSLGDVVKVKVLDLSGHLKQTFTMQQAKANLRLNSLTKGIYMLQIITNQQTYTQQLVVK
ncbi:GEVED domain-containing protein [Microscilla marina]|nr:GEVED domain-containing protein [Microscilla marina]